MKKSCILVLILLLTLSVCVPFGAQAVVPDNLVRLVYFHPRDRVPQPDIDAKIDTLIKEIQRFFADEMQAHGYGRKTFAIHTDATGQAVVRHQVGRFNEADYLDASLGVSAHRVYEEIRNALPRNHFYLAVVDVRTQNNAYPCGLGGENMAFIDAYGPCFDASIAAHEMVHGFGVAHVTSSAFLMSTIYPGDKRALSPCTASFLDGISYFNPDLPRLDTQRTTIQMLASRHVPPYGLGLRFKFEDVDGLHHVHLDVETKDRQYRSIYMDACESLSGRTAEVEFLTTNVIPESPYVLLSVVDSRGNAYRQRVPVDINAILPSEVIEIPDVHLAEAIREALVMAPDAPITTHNLRALIDFYAHNRQITDLTGLEHAINLRKVDLGAEHVWKKGVVNSNSISDISPIAGATQLETLFLDQNPIRDLTPLMDLTNLRALYLSENHITDVRPLVGLPRLETLRLARNPMLSLAPLRTLLRRNLQLELDVDTTQSTPLVLLGAWASPRMYWIDATHGTLHRLRGRRVENLLPGVRNATSLAVNGVGGKLYWTEQTGPRSGRIRSARLNGTPNVKVVKELTSRPIDMTLDAAGGKIYLTNSWGKVQRLNVDGTDFQPNLITGLKSPDHIALDLENGKMYWTERASSIRRANLDGSNVETLATGVANPTSLLIADAKLYWTTQPTQWTGHIHCADLKGFKIRHLASVPGLPQGIVVETTQQHLYWANTLGGIQRSDLNGKNIQTLVRQLGSPRNLAFDGRRVSVDPAVFVDFNGDGRIDQIDYLVVVNAQGKDVKAHPHADLNKDGRIDVDDLLIMIEHFDEPINPAAPALGDIQSTLSANRLQATLHILRTQSDGSLKYQGAIAILEHLIATAHPEKTQLLANYPNPFNPETWIPYQLATDANVNIRIYDTRGNLVRCFELGHRPAGIYASRGHAAYWDGRNELGEKVASDLYFYTLTAGDFTATRKMVIRK